MVMTSSQRRTGRPGATQHRATWCVVAFSVALFAVTTSDAWAADGAPGAAALRQARVAWDRGSLETAEPLYREALEKGGLSPTEVLEGYVRLGSIRAALGKKDSAMRAFVAAAILDEKFSIPSEAGPKGHTLAEKARRDTAKIGSIQLAVQVPKEAASGKAFKVTATLDKSHMPIVNKIGLTAKDGTTGKEVTLDAKPEESVEFEIAGDITLPGASILVHIDALDAHQNRLASAEERVKVAEDKGAPSGAGAGAKEKDSITTAPLGKPQVGDAGVRRGGGFWSSPWPYVIGGIAIAGAGAAVYFGTRPSESVSVGQVNVNGT
jgi:hypothetical protein